VATVPAYRPDAGFADRLARVSDQVAAVVVIDDGSGAAPTVPDGVELIIQPANLGIAAALNRGIERARELGATHVLTLDQDTVLGDGYVEAALGAFDVPDARVGSAVADVINGTPQVPTWTSPTGLGLAPDAIQSGMLISLACLVDVGGFEEALFIDSVDREFCHRIRARGWDIAIAPGTAIEHAIGRLEPLRDGGEYEWHEPFRQYYIVRNAIIVARRYRKAERAWSRALLRQTLDESRRITRHGPRRGKHTLATAIGGLHGLFARRGRIPRWLERSLR
jgi:rhamnosyltransferase